MKYLFTKVLIATSAAYISLSLLCPAVPAEEKQEEANQYEVPQPGNLEQLIARSVAMRLGHFHYRQKKLNDSISEALFKEYFQALDRNHYYFLSSDVEAVRSYKSVLDDQIKKGNIDFAYEVYARFVERVENRVAFAEEYLKKDISFDGNQKYEADRSDISWPVTNKALDKAWRRRLKNEVLQYRLMQRDREEEEDAETGNKNDKKPQEDNKGSGDAKDTDNSSPDTDNKEQKQGQKNRNKTKKGNNNGAEVVHDIFDEEPPAKRVLNSYKRYLKRIKNRKAIDILEIYLSALAGVYDPHSAYLAPRTEEDFNIQMKLSLQGIGAVPTTEDGYVKIVDIIPGGPADEDGRLGAGDRIIAVRQENKKPVDVINMPLRKVVDMIRGKKGTTVSLTVVKAEKGIGSVPTVIKLTRDKVELKAKEAKSVILETDQRGNMLSPSNEKGSTSDADRTEEGFKILTVRLPSFYRDFKASKKDKKNFKSSSRDIKRILNKHKNDNVDAMILDLRSNGGGSLQEAIKVAGLFFPRGPVVQVRYSNGKTKALRDKDGKCYFDKPLVVLVNHLSASASEIVAGALQDYGRAVIVGAEQTHGKGTVQTMFHLKKAFRAATPFKNVEPGSLKFTIAKFYRVNGRSTQLKGVTPDITYPSFRDHLEISERSLPHALPWDKINKVDTALKEVSDFNVNQYVDKLQSRSGTRRHKSETYKDWLKVINRFAEQQKRNTLPLNIDKRLKLYEEQEELSNRISKYTQRHPALQTYRQSENEKEKEKEKQKRPEKSRDFLLRNALHVTADLIHLQRGENLLPLKEQEAEKTITQTEHEPEKAE